ncbi:MAG: winged helix-turn-helix transcriptional regulator [Clostridiales bacterium]|nr:winged helix-turn-helix transcriptional regulator [Clostridiales bacterium]
MSYDMPVGAKFSLIGRKFKGNIDDKIRAHGLTGVQLGVLGCIKKIEAETGKGVRQKDIEVKLDLTHQTLTEIIKKLEANGFVECAVNADDKRSKLIRATDKAREMDGLFKTEDEAYFAKITEGIPEDDLSVTLRTLDRLVENIKRGDR